MNDDDEYDSDFDDQSDDDDDFDYESFVEDNFGTGVTNTETKPLWRLVAVVLLVVFIGGLLLQIAAL
ncbi:hypothetical protein [Rubripirellula lacrimiformis]|nr:hypothetical protein [Rubripirellula lacrimiformis]